MTDATPSHAYLTALAAAEGLFLQAFSQAHPLGCDLNSRTMRPGRRLGLLTAHLEYAQALRTAHLFEGHYREAAFAACDHARVTSSRAFKYAADRDASPDFGRILREILGREDYKAARKRERAA